MVNVFERGISMEQWYILRNQQQFGPYTVEQMLQMASRNQLYQGDLYAPVGGKWMPFEHVFPIWNKPRNSQRPPKKSHGCLISFLIGLIIFVVLSVGTASILLLTHKSNNLKFGRRHKETTMSVPQSGGSITVDDSTSEIDGFAIVVPENAYPKDKQFEISTTQIKDSNFLSNFQPITPLITIDNGHEFADEPMTVTIPIEKTDEQFAMGFYYDKKTGELEGIPFSDLSNDSITLVTCHFSDILVAVTDREALMSLEIDTGFVPGYDDWQFANYGSWIAPGGHCAGQAISMTWYFTEKYQGAGERRLYGRYDNNKYGYGTIDFQDDDSLGYRFASVIQAAISFDSYSRTFQKYVVNRDAYDTYCAFAFSMQMTGEPQYLSIRGNYTKDGKTSNVGHAITVYKIDKGVLYVADPNTPGQGNRTIAFGNNSFANYYSGINATQITEDGEITFNEMYYYAKTSMIDYATIANYYKQVEDGTIGSGKFVDYTIERLVKIDPVTNVETWEPVKEEYKLSTEDTTKVSPNLAGKMVFRVKGAYSNIATLPYSGLNPVKELSGYSLLGSQGYKKYTLDLEKGMNHFGIYTMIVIAGTNGASESQYYNDFKRIKVIYDQVVELEFEDQPYTVIQDIETEFEANCSGTPSGTVFQWDFGDGTQLLETKGPKAKHVYEEPGDYAITLKLISTKDSTELAEATAGLTVTELYGMWDMKYTIEDAGSIDYIINFFMKMFIGIFEQILGESAGQVPEVSIEGTVVHCNMMIHPPETQGGTIRVQVQQLSSSTDFVEVSEEIWNGIAKIEEQDIKITITSEGQDVGFNFTGKLDEFGMNGKYNAVVMSGSFEATHQ